MDCQAQCENDKKCVQGCMDDFLESIADQDRGLATY